MFCCNTNNNLNTAFMHRLHHCTDASIGTLTSFGQPPHKENFLFSAPFKLENVCTYVLRQELTAFSDYSERAHMWRLFTVLFFCIVMDYTTAADVTLTESLQHVLQNGSRGRQQKK